MDDYIILNYLSHQLTKIKSSRLIEIQNTLLLVKVYYHEYHLLYVEVSDHCRPTWLGTNQKNQLKTHTSQSDTLYI